jgi:hypothetical protein
MRLRSLITLPVLWALAACGGGAVDSASPGSSSGSELTAKGALAACNKAAALLTQEHFKNPFKGKDNKALGKIVCVSDAAHVVELFAVTRSASAYSQAHQSALLKKHLADGSGHHGADYVVHGEWSIQ